MYNRRGGMQNQHNLGGIGRRRPQIQNNFVSGGQLTPQKGGIQQGFNKPTPQANKPQQSQGNTPVRPQQQQQQQQQQQPNVQPKPAAQTPTVKPPQAPQPQVPPPPPQVVPQQQVPQPQPEVVAPVAATQENGNAKPEGEKKKWMMRKIPKRERIRKRNMRLGKLLQPKNALMVLNEIVMNSAFEVVDFHTNEGTSYKATVVVEGQEHVGFGKSKTSAKNSAAESALKHLVKSKKMLKLLTEDCSEKMDTSEGESVGETSEPSLPWQQVASFALFKLFDSWGESPVVSKEDNQLKELKPAKKLPENAETLNPLMVVNQMFPNAQFEELPRSGNPPSYTFNVQITVDGQTFTGSGPTKKLSKRTASQAICTNLLGIKYSSNDTPSPAH